MAPFRDDNPPLPSPTDPLERFVALHDALDAGRGWFGDRVPLRYAAVTLLTTDGEPEPLAASVRQMHEALAGRLGFWSGVAPPVRMLLASQLVKHGDSAEAFIAELDRIREQFRAAGVRRGGVYEVLGVLVLRRVLRGQPVESEHVARFKAIYSELKRHHWFLTGPDDYPACAMLVGQPGEPRVIGDEIEAVYQALRTDAALWSGEALQTAANVLYLTHMAPTEVAGRFAELAAGFKAAGYRVRQPDYDEIAVLCFLATPADKIIATVMGYLHQMRDRLSWVSKRMGLSLAASLAFVRLVDGDPRLGAVADAKLLLDMQAIVAARQAAAAAAA